MRNPWPNISDFENAAIQQWADRSLRDDYRHDVVGKMFKLLDEDPELFDSRSLPEIRALAERRFGSGVARGRLRNPPLKGALAEADAQIMADLVRRGKKDEAQKHFEKASIDLVNWQASVLRARVMELVHGEYKPVEKSNPRRKKSRRNPSHRSKVRAKLIKKWKSRGWARFEAALAKGKVKRSRSVRKLIRRNGTRKKRVIRVRLARGKKIKWTMHGVGAGRKMVLLAKGENGKRKHKRNRKGR